MRMDMLPCHYFTSSTVYSSLRRIKYVITTEVSQKLFQKKLNSISTILGVQFIIAARVNMTVFWDVTPCGLVKIY
jgi:hypothetical protein